MLGYDKDHLIFLLAWLALTLACLVVYRLWRNKSLLILPPALALLVAGWQLGEATKTSDPSDVGYFFLFVLALLHTLFTMLMDARATDFRTKVASLAGLVIAGFAYFTDNAYVFGVIWVLTILPPLFMFDGGQFPQAKRVFSVHHLLSIICLFGGLLLLGHEMPGFASMQSANSMPYGPGCIAAAVLLMMASLIRQAMFPFHLWFKASYKTKPFPLSIGFYSQNLGFLLFMRLAYPLLAHEMANLSYIAMVCGVLSSLFFASMALVQTRLRSTVFHVMLAQYATLYCGLEVGTRLGKAGVLFQFLTLGCAFTGLIACFYVIEWYFGELKSNRFHGLQEKNPVLSVIFLLFAFCAVALPSTMGFAGEDIIFHAVIERYPFVGIGLIVTAALNGISLWRVVTFIFRGTRTDPLDARLNLSFWQKAALGMLLAVLFGFGLMPETLLRHVLAFV